MNLTLPQLVVGAAGALLIYAAIKNQSPVTIIKDALNGTTTSSSGTPMIVSDSGPSQGSTSSRIIDRGGLNGLAGEGSTKVPVITSKVWVDPKTGKMMSV